MKKGMAVVLLVITVFIVQVAFASDETMSEEKFFKVAQDLVRMDSFFARNKQGDVTFDVSGAKKRGFSRESISFARETAQLTNELIGMTNRRDSSVNIAKVEIDFNKFPRMKRFFQAATKFHLLHTGDAYLQDMANAESLIWTAVSACDLSAYCKCGSYVWPRPSKAATAKKFNSSNPASTLKSWGYHETPSSAGGGWTRAQTWGAPMCGWNTYRDHAWPSGDNKAVYEQNYSGWSPRGEPNPEVWRSGPWPYNTWPAYVYWWHRTY